MIILILLIIFLIPNDLYAKSVGDHMGEFWNSLDGVSNITDPGFIKAQKAGHLSLGGLQMRSNIQNAQLASVRLPSLKAGCGGIDFYAGGLSFINSDQLVALMKSIGSNAQGALVQLAIDNLSPKIGSIIKYFQNLSRQINALNINSCEAARSLVNGPFDKFQGLKTQGCKLAGHAGNAFKDGAGAFEACTSGGQATSTLRGASQELKDQFQVGNVNIAWKALKDSGLLDFSSADAIKTAELLMTLSGTIIINDADDDSGNASISYYSPSARSQKTANILLEGGNLDIMECEDFAGDCLSILSNNVTISKDQSYLGKVSKAITEISQAIKTDDDSALSDGTYKLLSFSAIPIYKILNTHSAYYNNTIEIGSIAEFLALDILYGYLQKVNQTVRKAASKYNKEPHSEIFKIFFEDQKEIKEELYKKRQKLSAKFKDYLAIIERTALIEEMLQKDVTNKVRFGGNY